MSAARRASAVSSEVSGAEQTTAEVEAAEKFIADLIARGEAVEKNDGIAEKSEERQNDALPPGVTHEIVRRDGEKAPAVRRRRYSAF